MSEEPIILIFNGGMNNRETPLELFLRKRGEVPTLINADTTYGGRLKLLRPLTLVNAIAETTSLHTIFRANDVVLVGAGTNLKYDLNGVMTLILADLTASSFSMAHAGNWVFIANGSNKNAIYLPDKTGCDGVLTFQA